MLVVMVVRVMEDWVQLAEQGVMGKKWRMEDLVTRVRSCLCHCVQG
jgi:hypothetical protein